MLIVSLGIEPGYSSLSQVKIIMLYSVFGVLQAVGTLEILTVHQVGFDDPSRVSC
jgi:hypothetical protein